MVGGGASARHHGIMHRELVNADTNEQLKVDVDTDVREPNGERARTMKVTVRRKLTA